MQEDQALQEEFKKAPLPGTLFWFVILLGGC